MVGLWSYFQIGGSVENAENVANQLLLLAENEDSPGKKVQALYCVGYSDYRGGKFNEALDALLEAQRIVEANSEANYSEFTPTGDDGRIHNPAVCAHVCCQLGDVEKALELNKQAIDLAEELQNPIGMVFALFLSTWLMQFLRDYEGAILWGERIVALATEKNLKFWLSRSTYIMAWARFNLNREPMEPGPEEDLELMLKIVNAGKKVGAMFGTVSMFIDTAEGLAWNNRLDEATQLLEESADMVKSSGENYLISEISRARGVVEQQKGNMDAAINRYKEAIEIAEGINAYSYRKRAAENLSDLYIKLDRNQESSAVLEAANLPISKSQKDKSAELEIEH